jgi:hypothetical protein
MKPKSPYKMISGGLAHRVIVEQSIGRTLGRFELVHHRNHDKRDNRLENLEIVTPKEHSVHHLQKHPVVKTCKICGKEYSPPIKHRARSLTCSKQCRYALVSLQEVARVFIECCMES